MTPTCEMLLAALAVACQCQAVAERAIEEYPNSGILWPDGSLEKWRETVDEMEHYRIEYVRKLATRFLADLPDDAPALADWQRLASITEAGQESALLVLLKQDGRLELGDLESALGQLERREPLPRARLVSVDDGEFVIG